MTISFYIYITNTDNLLQNGVYIYIYIYIYIVYLVIALSNCRYTVFHAYAIIRRLITFNYVVPFMLFRARWRHPSGIRGIC